MKITKLFFVLTLATLFACKPADVEPNPQGPVDQPSNEQPEEPEDKPQDKPIKELVPEATYALMENLDARVHPLQTNGLRNDYMSFFDVYADHTLFIDFYSPLEGEYLPSGEYPLGDGSSMTSAQEYTYITFETNGDLNRFVDGWAKVVAIPLDDGSVEHEIGAYYTLESGETVSLYYKGVLTVKQGF